MSPQRGYERVPGEPPRIIAHRGVPSKTPENTLASVRAALDLNVEMIEVDVHVSADDEVVVIHDRTLQRTTTGNGAVRSYTLKELADVDAGSWFDPTFADERIPTLNQVLDLTGPSTELNVEIKSYPFHRIDPYHLASRVIASIEAGKAADRVLITSFDSDVLLAVRTLRPNAPVGYLHSWMRSIFRDPVAVAIRSEASVCICARQEFRRSLLEEAHQHGLAVFVYTVNDPAEAQRLSDAGIDGLITDVAESLQRIIA